LAGIALVFMLSLAACGLPRLAREGAAWAPPQEDAFAGFFVTMGHSALQEYFGPFDDRIYAEGTDTSGFTFPGIEGIPFFVGTITGPNRVTTFSEAGPGIVGGGMHVHVSDGETRLTLSGTLYVTPRLAGEVFAFNPVFQTPDGEIYIARGGSSVSANRGGSATEGRVQSFRKEQTHTVTENGAATTRTASVELSIAVMLPPERIVILGMDADHQIVSIGDIAPGHMPETLRPHPDAAYLIVETHRVGDAESPVLRALYGPGDEYVETFYEMGNGVLNRRLTRLAWE
jgi:hypothetical protein